jgi:hypothetical protein
MKRYSTGILVLDGYDILCVSFFAGSLLAYIFKRYKNYTKITSKDMLVDELKKKSPINILSQKENVLQLPLMRGGANVRGFSLMIKSKKLARILMAIVNAKKNQKKLRLLQVILFTFNELLASSTGCLITANGSLTYSQISLIVFSSGAGGFILGILCPYIFLLPLGLLIARGTETIPDPYERCRLICKAAEKYHNRQMILEMKNLDSLLVDPSLQLSMNEVPLLCIEQPLSLLERYKLKQIIKTTKVQERAQHFSEFIKKFSECDADAEAVYQEVMGNIQKIPIER